MTTAVEDKGTLAVKFLAELSVPNMHINDIFTTAIEGSISYWARLTGPYVWNVPLADIRAEIEDEEGETHVIDFAAMKLGIERFVEYVETDRAMSVLDPENGDYDADDADTIVQLALYNEVRYA